MFDIFDLILGPFNPFSSDEKNDQKEEKSESNSFDFYPKDDDDDDGWMITRKISRISGTAYFLNFITISFNFSTI